MDMESSSSLNTSLLTETLKEEKLTVASLKSEIDYRKVS